MRKIFTFLFAALMSAGMWADPNIVTPTISGDKEFTESTTVTMTCPSPNADIYYTIDGFTDPRCDCAAAPEYKQPITITETTIIKAAAYDGNDWSAVAEVTFTKKGGEPQPQMDKTAIYAAYPAENHPAEIEIAFINRDFTWGMEALDNEPWYASELDLMTSAEDTIKFRDKANNAKILCEFIPANGDQDGRWQQMYVKMANYEVVSFKGEMVRLIEELDLRDAAKYAWMENAPEPLPAGIENIVLTEKAKKVIVDGMVYIVRDGKTYTVQGWQVR